MCGLVGIVMKQTGKQFPVSHFVALMNEARIRGQHATGVSYFHNGKVVTHKEPVPADRFEFPEELANSPLAIGHLRYSTSDLQYNQPNSTPVRSLVHNGVVTQEPYDQWEDLFGVKCETRNDSEIFLRLMERGVHPLSLVNTSQACIAMETIGGKQRMSWWRNEQRPLYYVELSDLFVVASTKDIIKRALGNVGEIRECVPCVNYCFVVDQSTGIEAYQ